MRSSNLKTKIYFEGDSLKRLSQLEYKKVFIIADPVIVSSGLINAVNLLDLDEIIIYGEYSYRSEMLCAELAERINKRSVITRTHGVNVRFSDISPDMVKASVCAAILNYHFEQKL